MEPMQQLKPEPLSDLPQSKGLSLVLGFVRSRPRPYALALVLGIAASGLSLLQPLIIKNLIKGMSTHQALVPPVLLLIALFIGAAALSAVEEYILEATGETLVHEIRTRVAAHVLRLPLADHNRLQAGDLISRVTADTTILQELATTDAADTVVGGVTMIASIVIMATLDPVLLGLSMSTVVIGGLVIAKLFPRARRASVRAQRGLGRVASALDRSLRAIRTVKISGAEGRETAQIAKESADVRDAGFIIARFQAIVDPTVNLTVQAALIIVLGVGAAQVANGTIQFGDLVAFLLYLTRVVAPVGQFFGFAQQMQRGAAANLRLREVLDLPIEAVSDPATLQLPVRRGAVGVEFKDVTFGYEDSAIVLDHVSAVIEPGTCVAFVGPSGAGKTTLFSLLAGFYVPTSGQLLVDGVDTRDIPLSQLRQMIGMVEQDAPVMDGTIGDNIRYAAPDSSPAAVTDAVRRSGLAARIESLPDGLETLTGNSGSMLSGGERQRVAIARSLLASPRLLLLDEVTSQLDSLSERDMRETIRACASADCTVIVVAHRLSTVREADRIVVLRDRTVEAIGTHDELMVSCPFYRTLVAAQFLDPDTASTTNAHDQLHPPGGTMTTTQALQDKADALLAIRQYINNEAFQAVLADMYRLEREDREDFVSHILTDPDAMAKRSAAAPAGVFISTSEFKDGRPTLFAVCKYLPDGDRRMTVTFDDVPTGRRATAST